MILDKAQHASHLLAGVVSLPAPFPATCRVSVAIFDYGDEGEPEVYLELLQVVDQRRTVFRTIRFEDLRAIRVGVRVGDKETPAHLAPLQSARQIADKVQKIVKAIVEGSKKPGKTVDDLLFEQAIVYVPEQAPILHRSQVGVTAGESAVFHPVPSLDTSICCHKDDGSDW